MFDDMDEKKVEEKVERMLEVNGAEMVAEVMRWLQR
jgi:hypothetical protein